MKKRLRIKILISLSVVLLLTAVVLFTNVYLVILGPLQAGTRIDSNYGDVILVLGGGLRKGREIGYSTEERLLLAVQLFKQKNRPIIISGGSLYRGSPAIKKVTDFLEQRGVKKEFVRFEGKSQTTYDNFFNSRKLINEMKSKEVIVCTSPYHQGRAKMILEYLEFNNFKIAYMEQSEIYQAHSLCQRLRNLRLILREYLAILKFKIFKK